MKRYLPLLLFCSFLFMGKVFARTTFLNTNTPTNGSTNPATSSFYVAPYGAASGTVAIACIGFNNNDAPISSVTFGGQTMTSAGADVYDGGYSHAQVFYLTTPPTGTSTLSVTVSGSQYTVEPNVVVFTNVNTSTVIRAGTYQTSSAASVSSISQTISSNPSDLTMSCISNRFSNTSSTNQTNDGMATYYEASDHATTPSTTVTHTWTMNGVGTIAMIGFSIQGATSSPPSTCTPQSLTLDNSSYATTIGTPINVTVTPVSTSTNGGVCTSTLESNYSGSYSIIPATGSTIDCQGATCASSTTSTAQIYSIGCDAVGTYNLMGFLTSGSTSTVAQSAISTLTCNAAPITPGTFTLQGGACFIQGGSLLIQG